MPLAITSGCRTLMTCDMHTNSHKHLGELKTLCRQPAQQTVDYAAHEQLPVEAKVTESRCDVLLRIQYEITCDKGAGQ